MSTKARGCYAVPTAHLGDLVQLLDRLARPVLYARVQQVIDHVVDRLTHVTRYEGPVYEGDPADLDARMRHALQHRDAVVTYRREFLTVPAWEGIVADVTARAPLTDRERLFLTLTMGERVSPVAVLDLVDAAQRHFDSGATGVERSPQTDATLRVDVLRTDRPEILLLRPVAEGNPWSDLLGSAEAQALGVIDWSYWNDVDPDPSVPSNEWTRRARDWHAAEPMGLSWHARLESISTLVDEIVIDADRLPVIVAGP